MTSYLVLLALILLNTNIAVFALLMHKPTHHSLKPRQTFKINSVSKKIRQQVFMSNTHVAEMPLKASKTKFILVTGKTIINVYANIIGVI